MKIYFIALLYIVVLLASANAQSHTALYDLIQSKDVSQSQIIAAISSDIGLDLSGPNALRARNTQDGALRARNTQDGVRETGNTCVAAPAFKFCTSITYTISDAANALYVDDLLYASYQNASQTTELCQQTLRDFVCALAIPRCQYGENLDVCSSMCIDFTAKCGFFFSGWCLTDAEFAQNGECTEIISAPRLTCSVPTGLSTCADIVTYSIPTSPANSSDSWNLLDIYAGVFMFSIQEAVEIMKSDYQWSDTTAQTCLNTYREYYCRYTFFECKGDAYRVTPPCEYTCDNLFAACPGIWQSGLIGQTCLPSFPNLTCSVQDDQVSWSWSYGDPHLSTLDGYEYEFNGAGEYWLAISDDKSVQVQARFEPCGLGTCTTAIAFCLGANCANKYTILSSNSTALAVYKDGQPVSLPSLVEYDGVTDDPGNPAGVVLSLGAKTGYIQVTPGSSLTLMTAFKPVWYGKVKGLLGLFSGSVDDDLVPKTGGSLDPFTASQQSIFYDFGQTWRVSQAESLFVYTSGKTYSSINNLTYVPIFSDSKDFEFSFEAEAACEGLTGKFLTACMYDVTVTNNYEFAALSQKALFQSSALPSSIEQQLIQINPSSPPTRSPSTSSTTSTISPSTLSPTTTGLPNQSSGAERVGVSTVFLAVVFWLFM